MGRTSGDYWIDHVWIDHVWMDHVWIDHVWSARIPSGRRHRKVCMHGRVTASGAEAVEADHPAAAWKEVLRRAGAERRTSGLSGPRMFGLDNPAIARLIQTLPNAGRCIGFDGWLGERPPFVPLVRLHLMLDPVPYLTLIEVASMDSGVAFGCSVWDSRACHPLKAWLLASKPHRQSVSAKLCEQEPNSRKKVTWGARWCAESRGGARAACHRGGRATLATRHPRCSCCPCGAGRLQVSPSPYPLDPPFHCPSACRQRAPLCSHPS